MKIHKRGPTCIRPVLRVLGFVLTVTVPACPQQVPTPWALVCSKATCLTGSALTTKPLLPGQSLSISASDAVHPQLLAPVRNVTHTLALGRWTAESGDLDVLLRGAELEDSRGYLPAASYAKLASALERFPERRAELRSVLERGLTVSIRDADFVRAEWFGTRLRAVGGGKAISLLNETHKMPRSSVVIPGGMKALMFAARGRGPGSPERFLPEYVRTVLDQCFLATSASNETVDRIRDHFWCIRALEALGTRSGAKVSFSLSARDEHSRQQAGKVLDLLGWQLELRDGNLVVSAAERGSRARHQINASSLDVDELAMQEDLLNGRVFSFAITDDTVPVLLGERTWLDLLGRSAYEGGLAEALACNLKLAETYAGLSGLDDETIAALVSGVGLQDLLGRYAENLYLFSSALAVAAGRVLLPGGDAAEGTWRSLVNRSPSEPARFFSSLLRTDDGMLLAYYFILSQLDWAHQQFFTRSPSRTADVYRLFKDSIRTSYGIKRSLRDVPFADFLGDVPLDPGGRVLFPGGPEPWIVAKGQGSVSFIGRPPMPFPGAAAPGLEDEILVRLARTRYEQNCTQRSELDDFLAVARVEARRVRPMDARTALLLAQQFSRHRPVWPYFTVFTDLGYDEYSQFFSLCDRLGGYPPLRANDYFGQLASLLELLSLLHQAGRIDPAQATEFFRLLCRRFANAEQPEQFATASLDLIRELLRMATGKAARDTDAAVLNLLTDTSAPLRLEWKGKTYDLDPAAAHRFKYQRVLQLQKVTRLDPLLSIYDSLRDLAVQEGARADRVSRIKAAAAELQTVALPDSLPRRMRVTRNLESFQTDKVLQLIARLRDASPQGENLAILSRQIMAALSPQVRLALSGIVYAYYMDPEDLLVSEDPLFLRKHQFASLGTQTISRRGFAEQQLVEHQEAGAYLVGCFAGFGEMAGEVALAATQQYAGGAKLFATAQMDALRITRWNKVGDDDLRLIGLKIRGAREWIVESALNSDLRSALSAATLGLLSPSRRSRLLRSLDTREWGDTWQCVTLSDLYFLGDEFLRRYAGVPLYSPTFDALREAAAHDPRQPDWLGQDLQELTYFSYPHLVRLAPYEKYEPILPPIKLAERASEFKLYMADFAYRSGIPSRALEILAEPLARAAFRDLTLTDHRDWRAVLDAYSRLDESMLERVIQGP
jgi:hypothetical protein